MRPLSAAELLTVWEHGLAETELVRALTLLAAASPETSAEALATLSIGERDRRLFTLREWTFGSQLESVTYCSACNERVEWTVAVADLRLAAPLAESEDLSFAAENFSVSFRLPNTLDLAAAAECSDPHQAARRLLERSIHETRRGDQEIAITELPPEMIEAIGKRMADADPQSDLQLELACPACGNRWQSLFDIGTFFWSEINAWAQRLLTEVHTLARAYGWRELDIINLSPRRRQFYLKLGAG
jgi:hypothetical protein